MQYPCNKLRDENLNPLKRFDYRRSWVRFSWL